MKNHTCIICDEQLTGRQTKFCSSKCRNKYHYENPNLLPSSTHRHTNCIMCGKQLSGRQTKFCSSKYKNRKHQSYNSQKQRGLIRKLELVNHFGGQCQKCGYEKNIAGLLFHHTEDKNYQLDMRNLSNRTMDSILEEKDKCILLCHNYHMEIRYPELDIDI